MSQPTSGKLDLVGLLCVAIGMSIPLAFNLGKMVPLMSVSSETGDVLLWAGSVLGFVGVVVLSVRRLWFRDE